MKCCELCKSPAMAYCDSDQASLCWDCDLKVHGANFLVAKHSRILLCCVCHSPTPWSATGAKLGPTITVCERCAGGENVAVDEESEAGENDEIDYDEDEVDFSDGDEDEEEEVVESDDDEDNDNQVVPWSSSTLPPPPPATSSYSSGSEVSSPPGAETSSSFQRSRESSPDLSFQEDLGVRRSRGCTSAAAEETMKDGEELTGDYARPSKVQRTGSLPIRNRNSLVVDMISRIQRDVVSGDNFPAAITGLCKLGKCAEVVDLDSSAF